MSTRNIQGGRHLTSSARRSNRRRSQRGLSTSTRWLLRSAFSLACVVALVLVGRLVWASLNTSGRLSVRSVTIEGLQRAQTEEILHYSGIHTGRSIWGVDVDGAAQAIAGHPWVKRAQVGRSLQGDFTIAVVEHQPRLIVLFHAGYLVDREGVLFKQIAPGDPVDFPVLTGLVEEDFSPQRDLGPENPPAGPEGVDASDGQRAAAEAVALAAAYNTGGHGRAQLEGIHFDDVLGWSLTLRGEGWGPDDASEVAVCLVHLGEQPVSRLPFLDRTLAQLAGLRRIGKLAAPLAEVWLDHPNRLERVQWRTAPLAGEEVDWPVRAARAGGHKESATEAHLGELNDINQIISTKKNLVAKAENHGS